MFVSVERTCGRGGEEGRLASIRAVFADVAEEVLGRLAVGLMLFCFACPSYVSQYSDFEGYTKCTLLTGETSERYSIISPTNIIITYNIIFYTQTAEIIIIFYASLYTLFLFTIILLHSKNYIMYSCAK